MDDLILIIIKYLINAFTGGSSQQRIQPDEFQVARTLGEDPDQAQPAAPDASGRAAAPPAWAGQWLSQQNSVGLARSSQGQPIARRTPPLQQQPPRMTVQMQRPTAQQMQRLAARNFAPGVRPMVGGPPMPLGRPATRPKRQPGAAGRAPNASALRPRRSAPAAPPVLAPGVIPAAFARPASPELPAMPPPARVTNNPETMRSEANTFRRGLTPQHLRRQIILTEILLPPVSLRDPLC